MLGWLIIFTLFLLCIMFIKSSTKCTCETDLTNKVVIITGANSGIGFCTAKELAKRKGKIILACRDETKGLVARDTIIEESGNQNVVYKHLDLASFKSVQRFAKEILDQEKRLDILINNAGVGKLDNSLTEDKLPIEMQTNHFSPFLLTTLLLPLIKSSAPSRIIFVSSLMHWFGTIDFNTLHKQASSWLAHSRVYSNSKLANVLITKELSRRLKDSKVTVNCLHPGAVNTEIYRNKSQLFKMLLPHVTKTPLEGAQTSIYLALSPDVSKVTGKYFSDSFEAYNSFKANDEKLAAELWDFTEKIVNERLNNKKTK